MKTFIVSLFITATVIPAAAFAIDPTIHWATNSGTTESQHIAGTGEDLNASHQQVTITNEGVWAKNSGSIRDDEAALSSTKGEVVSHPELMPHQG
ncbi:hypothetical protein [Klebsiella aerogenes]|uniref:hypothetical protein n=1 Tax=Klebsiella aerogenes TaxID=548 RepID=UPI001F242663|nr:hypothetical protein [Klebsiella aerogenes]